MISGDLPADGQADTGARILVAGVEAVEDDEDLLGELLPDTG